MMDTRDTGRIIVRALIELGVETTIPPLDSRAGQFAQAIRARAAKAGHIKTPDGWFVPIRELLSKIEDLTEFLDFESLQYREFEVAGGFEIVTPEGESLGIPLSANFRAAIGLAETIINLHEKNEVHDTWVGAQDIWEVSLHNERVRILIRVAGYEPKEFWLPSVELREQLREAETELKQFADKLESMFPKYHNPHITPEVIQWMFSLDKL